MTARPYQGYPYTQPHVTEAHSIDAATASRWNNLPRRLVKPPTNVVYVELEDEGGSQVVWRTDTPNTEDNGKKSNLKELDETPVIYIDVPDAEGGNMAGPASDAETDVQGRNDTPSLADKKPEGLEAPVIYIDLPGSSSDVASPAEVEDEPEFVRETIFYDPFENRRIDPKEAETDSEASTSPRPVRPAPARPNRLPLTTAGYGIPGSSHSPGLSNDTYARCDDARFPIPISRFPAPPPAYSEINTPHTPRTPHTYSQASPPGGVPSTTEPPRTIVITPGSASNRQPNSELPSPIGLPSPTRKVVNCQFCGKRVHTLVIREAGVITHAIAIVLSIFMLFPLVILIYCTNGIKYQNHYCPNCNHLIGYELPCPCISMRYNKKGLGEPPYVVNRGI